jgi:7,8-dihydropterin-6-yl-methyl-4-(beta-D-ribofuranosyl)aminobenzene 5'-phosphate synthase
MLLRIIFRSNILQGVAIMNSRVRITVICENRAPGGGVLGEHGLSVFLETGGRRILFDTGAGRTLLANAKILGVDLSRLDAVVLSHGHYDHTGGLQPLLGKTGAVPVYAHPDIFIPKYRRLGGSPEEEAAYIGPPWSRQALENLGAQFHLQREPFDLGGGAVITGEIPRPAGWKNPEPYFLQKTAAGFQPDLLYDDQALLVESPAGVVVILGCSHAGLLNTLRHVKTLSGKRRLYALLGGTHLLHASGEQLAGIMEAVREYDLQLVAPCHCTGILATLFFYRAFGEKFAFCQAGSILEFT